MEVGFCAVKRVVQEFQRAGICEIFQMEQVLSWVWDPFQQRL